VSRNEVNPYNFNALPIEEENALLASDAFTIDQYFYLSMSAFTLLPSSFDIPKRNIDEAVFTFIQRVNVFVNQFLKFDLAKADPQRKPESIITEKRGVCQDYTHLMLGILRSNSIPSRYVSGYLNQGNALEGSGAIHAWVQALIPGVGWIGFDPTNNLLEDHHYIKIAHGADIDDCTTLKGVIKGSGTNLTDYHVLVEEQNKKETNQ